MSYLFINEEKVSEILTWDRLVYVLKQTLIAVTNMREPNDRYPDLKCSMTERTFTRVPHLYKSFLDSMCGYVTGLDLGLGLKDVKSSGLVCKVITSFSENVNKPIPKATIQGMMVYCDETDGTIKGFFNVETLIAKRTAAISLIAADYLWLKRKRANPESKKNCTLAVIGTGVQAQIHIIAFSERYKFSNVRVWGRNSSKVSAMIEKLRSVNIKVQTAKSIKECVDNADCVVTTTSAMKKIIEYEWIKPGAHCTAIGVTLDPEDTFELDQRVYENSKVYVESLEAAGNELPKLKAGGELGELITGVKCPPEESDTTVYQSMGLGCEDAAIGSLIYHAYIQAEKN